MARCEICGNEYDKAFQVIMDGETHVFDSFECAIQALAPPVRTAAYASLGTAWRMAGRTTAVPIVLRQRA